MANYKSSFPNGAAVDAALKAATSHKANHKSGGSDYIRIDELAAPTDTTTLNASTSAHGLCPKGEGTGTKFLKDDLTWDSVTAGSVTYGTTAGTACEGNDTRLSDDRNPNTHATSHKDGGTDYIRLDELAAATTDARNATTSNPGLCPAGEGTGTKFLKDDLTWDTPAGGTTGSTITLPGSSSVFYNGLGGWSTPSASGSTFKPYITIGRTGSGADYECDGTSDNVQIQKALGDVSSGTQIVFLQGTYNCTSPLAINSKSLWLKGIGNVTINFALSGYQAAAMQFQGSSVLSTTLSSNASKGATSVVLTSVSGVSAGQLIVIYNDVIWSDYPDYNDICTGETYEIKSVSGSTVYLSDPLVRTYNTADTASARIFSPVEIHMENLNIVGDGASGDQLGLVVRYGSKISVNRCSFKDNNLSGIILYTCYDVDIYGNSINNCTLDGLGYGVAITTASAKARITHNNINNCRHCISVTSNKAVHGMNRDVIIANNVCYGSSTITGAIDAHPNCINWMVVNNIIHAVNRGIINGAQHMICEGNEFRDISEGAIFHNKVINFPRSVKISGNKCQRGGYFYSDTSTDDYSTVSITDNEIDEGYISIYTPSSKSRNIEAINISNNIIRNVSGKAINTYLENQNGPSYINIHDNNIVDCTQEGIYVDLVVAENSIVNISNNIIINPNSSAGGYAGIKAHRMTYSTIEGNIVYDTASRGGAAIATGTSCDYNVVVGNIARGTTGISLTGSNNVSEHNLS